MVKSHFLIWLPGIPPVKQVKENGADLGEMNVRLLRKIEELTPYLIGIGTISQDIEVFNIFIINEIIPIW